MLSDLSTFLLLSSAGSSNSSTSRAFCLARVYFAATRLIFALLLLA